MTDEAERIQDEFSSRDRDQQLAGRYRLTAPGHLFHIQQRERELLALLARHGVAERLADACILDIGCGTGGLLLDLLRYGAEAARLAGIDLVPERIATARSRLPQADLRCGDATSLPYADDTFDLVCQFTVVSTILDLETRQQVVAEIRRVLRPDGAILWYDQFRNNPRNRGTRAIGRVELQRLFPGCDIDVRTVSLAAPLARRVAPRAWLMAELLALAPLLRTHLLALIQPAAQAGAAAPGPSL